MNNMRLLYQALDNHNAISFTVDIVYKGNTDRCTKHMLIDGDKVLSTKYTDYNHAFAPTNEPTDFEMFSNWVGSNL